ncbi:AAA family ATPase [Actinoplanes sp. NPDC048967]|uniref:helix-turn-helix transcriptional regulator n=1 Tax=Actinoplanes sp. NPDC048967 TaxID=3155269 RepID=UPI0033D2E185
MTDRHNERQLLNRLVDAVRAGESQALVVRGAPGVGKTVLLDHLAGLASASGCRLVRVSGMQSEMELPFAGLHQLCAPMLSRTDRLPAPQRDALRTAFGLAAGPPPDRLMVGLAALSLLAGVATERPLICVIDDVQWLDQASAQALGFAARRLAADPVGLVLAVRDPSVHLAGLPELEVTGLRPEDARALLDSALSGPLDTRVRDLIVAETRGNPLALLELPRGLTPAELAGGFGLPGAAALTSRIEDSFRRQLDALPEPTRRLLQLAAADPSGDRALVWRAAGQHAGSDVLLEISHAVRALPAPGGDPRPQDLLLDGLARLAVDGHTAANPILRRAAAAVAELPVEDVLRWGWMAASATALLWDFDGMHAMAGRQVELVRSAGALARLPLHLAQLGITRPWMGDLAGTASLIAEIDSVAAATGSPTPPYTQLRLLAFEGDEAKASASIGEAVEQATEAGQGLAAAWAHWSAAVLYNGLARYPEAVSAARQATAFSLNPWMAMWAMPELVEAAARCDEPELARRALERLTATTQPSGLDTALGIEARCRALVSDGPVAETLYCEAIDRLSRTRLRPDLARAHLLFGEWLRRQARRLEARAQLRTAREMFAGIGMQAFAERARHELVATGEAVRRSTVNSHLALTPQEAHIARLARDGRTNPEIGSQLFLSARTVEWHLRKVFTKLGIKSRRELHPALARLGRDIQPI